MRRNRLLAGALCVGMSLLQLPVSAFAAENENIIYAADYDEDESGYAVDTGSTEQMEAEGDKEPSYTQDGYNYYYDNSAKVLTVEGTGTPYHGYFIFYNDYVNDISKDIKKIIFRSTGLEDAEQLFAYFPNATEIDVSGFDTSNVKTMEAMFLNCKSLETLDLSGFNTSKVTNMRGMFDGCESLKALDLAGFNTSKVTDMRSMFSDCKNLQTLNLKSFDTSNVETMNSMFWNCNVLSMVDVSGFDTGNVTDMSGMFSYCYKLQSLDVSGFDTAKVTNMYDMFQGCRELKEIDVTNFNTGNVTDMGSLFHDCNELRRIDVSHFNTAKVTSVYSMFDSCYMLESIDISSWDMSNVENAQGLFDYCRTLKSIDLSFWDASKAKLAGIVQGCDSLEVFKTPYNNTDAYFLPVRMVDENGKKYIERKTLIKTSVSLTLRAVGNQDDPDPEKPVPVVEGGIFVVNQKFNITAADCLGGEYGNYTVSPKGAATVAKGIVTVKKVPADGKITITGQVKNEKKKWVNDKAYRFTAEKPAFNTKGITFTRPYEAEVNPEDKEAIVDGKTLLKDTTVMPTTWISAKPAIAAVDPATGMITAVSKGSTKITAVYGDPASKDSAKYTISVKVNIPKINKSSISLQSGAGYTLKLNGAAKGSTVNFTSSDPESVSVGAATGKIKVLKYNEETEGKVTISASLDGYSFPCYACEVSVVKPELVKSALTVKAGKTAKVAVKNTKLTAKKGEVTFASSDETKATVDQTGKITGVSAGECTINVSVAGVTLPCTVNIQ